MSVCTILLLMVALCAFTACPAAVSEWFGLGLGACFNETCTVGQFCSKNQLEVLRGCRNCTDIVDHWCQLEVPQEFVLKYPSCEAACQRKLAEERDEACRNDTSILQKQIDDLTTQTKELKRNLSETDDEKVDLQWFYSSIALNALFFVLLILACLINCCVSRQRTRNDRSTAAPPSSLSSRLWRCLQRCFCVARQPRVSHQPDTGDSIPLEDMSSAGNIQPETAALMAASAQTCCQEQYLPLQVKLPHPGTKAVSVVCQPQADRERSVQPTDTSGCMQQQDGIGHYSSSIQPASGNTSSQNSSPKSDRSSLSDKVAPGAGTEHHPGDLDFNISAAKKGANYC